MSDTIADFVAASDQYRDAISHWNAFGGAAIKTERTARGMSLRAFADLIGIDYTYLSKIENKHISPSINVARKIVETR